MPIRPLFVNYVAKVDPIRNCIIRLSRLSILKSKALKNDPNIEFSNLFEYYNNVRIESIRGWAARCVSEILLNFDDEIVSETTNWIKEAIEADNRDGTIFELACDYGQHRELLKRKGDISKAKESFAKSMLSSKNVEPMDFWRKQRKNWPHSHDMIRQNSYILCIPNLSREYILRLSVFKLTIFNN